MTFPDDVTLSQWNQGWNESEMKKKLSKGKVCFVSVMIKCLSLFKSNDLMVEL